MGKAKRCKSVVLGASVAVGVGALGATGACPAAGAASSEAPSSHAPQAATARKNSKSRHRLPTHPQRAYVYEAGIGDTEATENEPNMECSGAGGTVSGATLADTGFDATVFKGPNVGSMERRHPAMFNRTYTLTLSTETTITVNWLPRAEEQEVIEESEQHNGEVLNPRFNGQEDTATIGSICAAATRPHAFVAEIGQATAKWVLAAPVPNLAALAKLPPTSITPNEYRVAFEVLPNGTVPPFSENVACLTTGKKVGNKEACNERERAEAGRSTSQ